MKVRLYLEWGSRDEPRDPFFCDYDLPFLPSEGMEFSLSVESADDEGILKLLPDLIVERLVFIDHDLSLMGEMGVDVHFKLLPPVEIMPLIQDFLASKKWHRG